MKQCKEMIKNSVDVCKKKIYVLPSKSIFVAKYPYPTHFKILVVSTIGFERLVLIKD